MIRLNRRILTATLLSACLFTTGCSTFNRDWKRAAVANDGLTGRWEGTWKSDVNGHTDRLRCLMTRTNEQYLARFHANYLKIFVFTYSVPLQVQEQAGTFSFSGHANLGYWAGGEYQYKGTATATNFHSVYTAKADHGVFDMTRPVAATP